MQPPQGEDLAGAQPGERAERVGDVQRLGEREIDAANVCEPLHERRRSRVVGRAHQPHGRARQVPRRVRLCDSPLDQVGEERRQDRDQDADRGWVQPLRPLQLDERPDASGVHLRRPQVVEVWAEVLPPAVAVLGAGAVGELAAVEERSRELAEFRGAPRIRWEPAAPLGEVAKDDGKDALRVFERREATACPAAAVLAPPDLPGAVRGALDASAAPLPSPTSHRPSPVTAPPVRKRDAGRRARRPRWRAAGGP